MKPKCLFAQSSLAGAVQLSLLCSVAQLRCSTRAALREVVGWSGGSDAKQMRPRLDEQPSDQTDAPEPYVVVVDAKAHVEYPQLLRISTIAGAWDRGWRKYVLLHTLTINVLYY